MSEDYYMDPSGGAQVEPEPIQPSPDLQKLIEAELKAVYDRSFSGRNPELGKMIKCQVCGRRHRSSIECKQIFKQLWVDEDLETGELSIQYAMVPLPEQNQKSYKAVLGAAPFKGKRLKPHGKRRPRPLHKYKPKIKLDKGPEV